MFVGVIKPFIKPFSFFVCDFFFLIFKRQTTPNKWFSLFFQIFKSNKTSIFLLNYVAGTEHFLISVSDLNCALSNERLL